MRRAENCMPSRIKFTSEIYKAWTTFLGSTTTAPRSRPVTFDFNSVLNVIIERAQNCQVCVQLFCTQIRSLVTKLRGSHIEHMKSLWNHPFSPSNITDIDRAGWNITCRWCQDSYIFPRDNIFPQCCALRENIIPWENITLLAVHRNVIFHDRPGQYLYKIMLIT